MWQCKQLNTLIMARCELTSLPAEVVALPNLVVLDLGRNLLTELPAIQVCGEERVERR